MEVGSMRKKRGWNNKNRLSRIILLIFIFMGVTNMDALGFLGFGDSANWKEEVMLHDGQMIIVERSLIRKGRHEVGQEPPIKEHTLTFTPPGSDKSITWKSEYTDDIGHSSLSLLALGIVNGTPYITTKPTRCLAYNKWGRPNPPYIFFKYVDQKWKQITLQEFPVEIKQPNVVLSLESGHNALKSALQSGFVSFEKIKELNSTIKQEEYKTIVRKPLDPKDLCPPPLTGFKAPYPIRQKKTQTTPDKQ
jgi:hypothetical protein